MAPPTPTQQAWRGRVETGLRIVAPALDLLLAAGDRLARLVEPDDTWEPPARLGREHSPPPRLEA